MSGSLNSPVSGGRRPCPQMSHCTNRHNDSMRLALIPAADQARHEMQDVRKYARWHANYRSDNRTYLLCVATKRLRIRAEEQQQETRQDGDA